MNGDDQRVKWWPTLAAYKVLGKAPPPEVVAFWARRAK